jgi:serine/threonine protein kinase
VQTDKNVICSSCHSANNLDARFCNNCGATLPVQKPAPDVNAFVVSSEAGVESQAQQDALIGRIIEGKYRLDSLIGTGGMGAVYGSHRLLIGDEVAIKILHTERVVDPHASERFRREARAAARLKHPNAVSIYDFGVSSDGLQYLVMELIEGQSLREFAKQQGPLDASLAAEVTLQVCAALDEAHRQHIVHRDIKPDNIILNATPTGLRVKVLDFGIAKLRDDTASHLTQTGSVMGTPHYMSPEQCLGEELDSRADIYSMGVVVYEMLCGRVPFNSPISTAVVVQHVNQPPPPLQSLNPAVSPAIAMAVLRALEKSRDARPQTAGTFAQEVFAAVRSSPIVIGALNHLDAVPGGQSVDETTLERSAPSVFKAPNELAATVHLSTFSGSTNSVPLARATGGNGTVSVNVFSYGKNKFIFGGVALILLLSLAGGISWLALRENDKQDNRANASNTNSAGKGIDPPTGMVHVPGGTFIMGSNNEDQDSQPAHSVTVKPFFIDSTEVSCEQYKNFLDATGRSAPAAWANGSYPDGAARLPVTGVSWNDADAYARWAGKRLPTEEEWELAARGPNSLKYPWGNSWRAGCANADEEGAARKRMAEVGSHKCTSPFGTEDMIGNAWEWTASDWVQYPGGKLQYPTKGNEKVIRGGSWESSQKYASGVYRSGIESINDKSGYETTGFRCAKDSQ